MPSHEVVIGIDPGIKGAIVVMESASGKVLEKSPIPNDDIHKLYRLFFTIKQSFPTLIISCEKAQTLPGGLQSVKGAFTSGRNFGALEACIQLLYVPVQYVPPVTWQAEMLKGSDGHGPKERALRVAKNLWPCENFVFHRKDDNRHVKPHDGLVDAMLIAEFLRRRIK